jgi:hypothetical protein
VEDMYRSIWQLHVFLDSSQFEKHAIVAGVLAEQLHFPNDELLGKKLAARQDRGGAYGLLAGDLHGEFAPSRLPMIVRRLDQEGAMRMRHGAGGESARDRALRIIREVEAESTNPQAPPASPKVKGLSRAVISSKEGRGGRIDGSSRTDGPQAVARVSVDPVTSPAVDSGRPEEQQPMFDKRGDKGGKGS